MWIFYILPNFIGYYFPGNIEHFWIYILNFKRTHNFLIFIVICIHYMKIPSKIKNPLQFRRFGIYFLLPGSYFTHFSLFKIITRGDYILSSFMWFWHWVSMILANRRGIILPFCSPISLYFLFYEKITFISLDILDIYPNNLGIWFNWQRQGYCTASIDGYWEDDNS